MQDQGNDHSGSARGELSDGVGPAVKSGVERRLHLQVYKYWYSLLDGRGFPAISEMTKDKIEPFRGKSFLVDFPTEIDKPMLRFIGANILNEFDGDRDLVGLAAEDVPGESILSRLTVHFTEVLAHRAPIGFEADYDSSRGTHVLYRGILLPFSDDDDTIHFILGVLNWREDEAAGGADLAAVSLPISEFFDEDEQEFAKSDHIESGPAPGLVPEGRQSDQDQPLGDGAEPETGLAGALAAGREAATAVHHIDGRSRSSLYDVLAHALHIYEEGLTDPEALATHLGGAGIRRQARAPFTPIIKLLFGAGYDKTRITEYATALSHAHRSGVSSKDLSRFLSEQEGGIKGCVMRERAARRGSASVGSSPGEKSRKVLRKAGSLGTILLEKTSPDSPEFTLLLGRRSAAEDAIEIIAELEQKHAQIEPLLRQAAKILEVEVDGNGGEGSS